MVHVIDAQGINRWADEQKKPPGIIQGGNGWRWGKVIPGRRKTLATGTYGKEYIFGKLGEMTDSK